MLHKEHNNNQIIDFEEAKRERKEPVRRKKIKNIKRKFIYGGTLIVISVVIGISVANIFSLKSENALAAQKLTLLENEKERLAEELLKVDSTEYVEQQAREQLKMVLPGEVLYVLKKDEE